jgi:hypothetical protein
LCKTGFAAIIKERWHKPGKAWFEYIRGLMVKGEVCVIEKICLAILLGVLVKQVYPRWTSVFTMLYTRGAVLAEQVLSGQEWPTNDG